MIRYRPSSIDYQFMRREKAEQYDRFIFGEHRVRECLSCHGFFALTKEDPELVSGVCPDCIRKEVEGEIIVNEPQLTRTIRISLT